MKENEMGKFEARLCAVEDALRGTYGEPGVITSVMRILRDLYEGADALTATVKRLERERIKWAAWLAGAVFMATIAANVVKFFLEHKK